MNIHQTLALLTLAAASLCSCTSPAVKAPPAKVSPFLSQTPVLESNRKVSPFALSGGSLETTKKGIYIAPVTLNYLRPSNKSLAKVEGSEESRQKAATALAEYAREQFIAAFKNSPAPRYTVQESPGKDCLTLELALIELNRNTYTGTVSRFAINTFAVPGTDMILAKTTRGLKGNIAIEGKVTEGRKGKVIYQFADHEESKSALLIPITDMAPCGQARDAIRTWAKQLEESSRKPPGTPVKDTSAMSFF